MTALAVNEVVCNKTSEFINTNEEKSTETITDSMKLAMAVDDDATADTIETTELSNGFTDLMSEKSSKESFLSDNAHSDSTSQPRSDLSTPMEDVDDNYSIKLVLSDDEEDVELETTEKRTEKIKSEINDVDTTENDKSEKENIESDHDSKMETKSQEIDEGNSKGTQKQNDVSVKDILSELDSCLTEENPNNLDNSNVNDVEMGNELSEESSATVKENEKEKNTEEDNRKTNDSNKDFQINVVATEENIQADTSKNDVQNDSTEADIQISNVSSEAGLQISNASTEKEAKNTVSMGDDIKISNVSTEEDYENEFKLSMEDNYDNDKSEEETDKQETKTDEDNTDNDEKEISKSIESNITNDTENNSETEKQTLLDSECVDAKTKRTSETFKRKIDESDDFVECSTETKKIKTDSIKSKTEESQTESNEKDLSNKSDDDKTIQKNDNKTIENDESKTVKETNESKTIVNDDIKTKEIDVNKTIEKDVKDEKKPSEIKKKLILKMLPLLFENEPIPNVNVEELILTKIIEGITLRTELATLRQKAQTQEQLIDQLRRKASHLSKQLEDINTVTHRLTIDLQNKDRPVAPVKITRSVGLQVTISSAPPAKRFSSTNPTNSTHHQLKKRPITNSTHHNNTPVTNNNNSSATNYNNSCNTSQTNINTNTPVKTSTPTTPAKSPSLLNKALTKPTSVQQRNALVVHSTPPKQQQQPEPSAKQNKTPGNKSVTVDLTDDDELSKKMNNSVVTQNPPPGLIPLTTGNLRMVPSSGNTLSNKTATNQPQRLSFLMAATPGQNTVLIATNPAAAGGARPALTVAQLGQPNVRGVQGTRYFVNTTNGQQAIVQRPGIVLTNGQTQNTTVRTVPVRVNNNVTRSNALTNSRHANSNLHPAPLPIKLDQPNSPNWRQIPPRPSLKISRTKDGGIQLSWSMPELNQKIHEEVASYQLYAYQEGSAPPSTDLWRKVGDVKALPLPMACTLTSFHPGNKYYFAVRAIDVHSRVSLFSYAQPISLHN